MREQRDSWLSLVMLCAVAVLSAALGLSVLFAGASVVFGVVQSPSVPSESPSEAVAQDSLSSNPFSGNSVTPDPQAQAVASEVQAFSGKEVDENGAASGQTFTGMCTDSPCAARPPMKPGKTSPDVPP